MVNKPLPYWEREEMEREDMGPSVSRLKQVLLLLNASSCAWHIVRSNKAKRQSLEQRKTYCRPKQGEWVARDQKTQTLQRFSGKSFHRQNLGWGLQRVWLSSDWLSSGWWDSRAVLQESMLSLKLPSSTGVGGLSSCRRAQRYCHVYSLRRNQDPTLIVVLLFLDCSSFVCAFPPFHD